MMHSKHVNKIEKNNKEICECEAVFWLDALVNDAGAQARLRDTLLVDQWINVWMFTPSQHESGEAAEIVSLRIIYESKEEFLRSRTR